MQDARSAADPDNKAGLGNPDPDGAGLGVGRQCRTRQDDGGAKNGGTVLDQAKGLH
jgi:hypothetical protein